MLDVLSASGRSMSLKDIALKASISKTTAFRYLQTLCLMGYVIKQPKGDYTLGPASFALSTEDSRDATLKSAALEEMEALAAEFGQRVSLGAPKGKRIYYISMIENDTPLKLRAESGDADYFHSTALGKAMVAFMPPERANVHLKSRLTRFTEHTLTTRRQLDQALSLVRKYGFAIDREENELGCVCYAATDLRVGRDPGGGDLGLGADRQADRRTRCRGARTGAPAGAGDFGAPQAEHAGRARTRGFQIAARRRQSPRLRQRTRFGVRVS